jgi:hypothetical protein
MSLSLVSGQIIIINASMDLWKRKGITGWMFVYRKPALVGRGSHTTADYNTRVVIFVEPYEGKKRMKTVEYVMDGPI